MADTLDKISCPACGESMTKVVIDGTKINVDICLDGCGGILFDNRELEKVDEVLENATEILKAVENKTFRPSNRAESLECPLCAAIMSKMGAGSGKVELDYCSFCGAKFLDNSELQRIREGQKDLIDQSVFEAIDVAIEAFEEDFAKIAGDGKTMADC